MSYVFANSTSYSIYSNKNKIYLRDIKELPMKDVSYGEPKLETARVMARNII